MHFFTTFNWTLLKMLGTYLSIFYPERMDPSLKPKDSAGCKSCRDIKFDFIIVGAGSAGCVVANRLSEYHKWNILLIEAGGDEDYLTDTPTISTIDGYVGTKYDWNYTTVKQAHTCFENDGICFYSRGHVMGGSSALNNAMFVRGNRKQDYNEWQRLGNPGWGYKDVLPYFLKLENMTIPELMTSPYHSTDGPVSISYGFVNNSIVTDLYKASAEIGLPNTDYNGALQYGYAYAQFNIKENEKCSSSKAYLDPIRDRPNLCIFKNTRVIKVLFDDMTNKRAIGVRCITNGEEYSVYSSKEVILSAGSINTPQLLMLSGVGPKKHLEELGIAVVADSPVGENGSDHPSTLLSYNFKSQLLKYSPEQAIRAVIDYAKYRSGPLGQPSTGVLTWFLNSTADFTDIQIIISLQLSGLAQIQPPGISILIANNKPKSISTVKLRSANCLDPPLINPNFLYDSRDKEPIKVGIHKVQQLMKTSALAKYYPTLVNLYPSHCNISEPLLDNDVECLIKCDGLQIIHMSGTAKMGPGCDKTAVVDPRLKVYGVDKLRVIDASIFPSVPSGNTNAPTMMAGEKGADLIKEDYSWIYSSQ